MTRETLPQILWSTPTPVLDDDCACAPEEGFEFDNPSPSLVERLRTTPGLYRDNLPGGYELVSPPLGPSSVVVLNQAASGVLDSFSKPETPPGAAARLAMPLDDMLHTIRDLAALRLLTPADAADSPRTTTPSRTLTAWLHITNACNLDCTYCYVPKSAEVMDESTGIAAVDAVFRSARHAGFETIIFKYAGGEPSLNFALVQTLHDHARTLAETTGITLHETLLSNGIALTPAMLAFLRENEIRLVISLDSLDAPHDQRIFANGKSSSRIAARAVERARTHGVIPHLSITVSEHTADHLAEIVTFALERDLPFNLNFVRGTGQAFSPASQARLIAGLRAAFEVIARVMPAHPLFGNLVDRAHFARPHKHSCGAGRNYLVIDQHGGVSGCQMQMHTPVTTMDADNLLPLIRQTHRGFTNLPVDDKPDCRACHWRYWCAGGCSLLALQTAGRRDARSPYCEVYRAVFPDVVRLEAMRLLKWQH